MQLNPQICTQLSTQLDAQLSRSGFEGEKVWGVEKGSTLKV